MGQVADAVTGRSARRQARLAQAAQNEQAARLEAERAKIARVEAAQRENRRSGGGLLAYVADDDRAQLRNSMGAAGNGAPAQTAFGEVPRQRFTQARAQGGGLAYAAGRS